MSFGAKERKEKQTVISNPLDFGSGCRTPLFSAAASGDVAALEFYLQALKPFNLEKLEKSVLQPQREDKADPNNPQGTTPFFAAVASGNPAAVAPFFKHCTPFAENLLSHLQGEGPYYGQTALHYAIYKGYVEIIDIMLKACDPEKILLIRDRTTTAHHFAISIGQFEIALRMLEAVPEKRRSFVMCSAREYCSAPHEHSVVSKDSPDLFTQYELLLEKEADIEILERWSLLINPSQSADIEESREHKEVKKEDKKGERSASGDLTIKIKQGRKAFFAIAINNKTKEQSMVGQISLGLTDDDRGIEVSALDSYMSRSSYKIGTRLMDAVALLARTTNKLLIINAEKKAEVFYGKYFDRFGIKRFSGKSFPSLSLGGGWFEVVKYRPDELAPQYVEIEGGLDTSSSSLDYSFPVDRAAIIRNTEKVICQTGLTQQQIDELGPTVRSNILQHDEETAWFIKRLLKCRRFHVDNEFMQALKKADHLWIRKVLRFDPWAFNPDDEIEAFIEDVSLKKEKERTAEILKEFDFINEALIAALPKYVKRCVLVECGEFLIRGLRACEECGIPWRTFWDAVAGSSLYDVSKILSEEGLNKFVEQALQKKEEKKSQPQKKGLDPNLVDQFRKLFKIPQQFYPTENRISFYFQSYDESNEFWRKMKGILQAITPPIDLSAKCEEQHGKKQFVISMANITDKALESLIGMGSQLSIFGQKKYVGGGEGGHESPRAF